MSDAKAWVLCQHTSFPEYDLEPVAVFTSDPGDSNAEQLAKDHGFYKDLPFSRMKIRAVPLIETTS
ncbi:hypothetical protein LCGC14_2416800 [marine sediment metagenome]|uniref:Uncharacterized protein n=1 Tax=marine sediment metagenome TaxID=412755 RepID=A0A0F9CD26_9ZZZZ